MDSYNEIWESIRDYLKESVSQVAFNVWLSPLKFVSFDNDLLTLSISEFKRGIVIDKFLELIERACEETIGFHVDVKIVIDGESDEKPHPYYVKKTYVEYNYTFDNFIIGPSNRFAHAAALSVANTPGKIYNPLFIYGHSGLGKTHLLMAIQKEIKQLHPDKNIIYTSGEHFTNELINCLRTKTNYSFREKYRSCDVLLVDDIQFIADKESTQEEFFHTFNTLQTQGKQIILTSDKPPKEMETLEERIRSRFEWGLMADIGVPDYETRMAILRKKAETDHFDIDDDILNYIASNISSNIRELEGALNKLLAFHNLEHTYITMDIAERELSNIITPDKPREITAQLIIEVVSEHFHISVDQMISKNRSSDIARPRQIAMYLCKTMTSDSLDVIGQLLGGRDHSTIIHGIKKVTKDYEENESTKSLIETIKKKINPN